MQPLTCVILFTLALFLSACAAAPQRPSPVPIAPSAPESPQHTPQSLSLPGTTSFPRTFLPHPTTDGQRPPDADADRDTPPATHVSASLPIPLDNADAIRQPTASSPTPFSVPTEALDVPLEDIFFETDSALLTPQAASVLRDTLTWLSAHPTMAITIEGHCDERGSDEYNLALGQHRALTVFNYLVRAGLDPSRFSLISYGKSLPFSLGHTEADCQLNRRVHFAITPSR